MVFVRSLLSISPVSPGELTRKGVVTPITNDIYTPVLEELKAEGIQATIRTQDDV